MKKLNLIRIALGVAVIASLFACTPSYLEDTCVCETYTTVYSLTGEAVLQPKTYSGTVEGDCNDGGYTYSQSGDSWIRIDFKCN